MTARNAIASKFAEKLSDAEFEGHMIEAINSQENDRRNPIVIMSDLNRIFGEAILEWPKPNTNAKDNPNDNNPAIVEVQDGARKVNVNFYFDLYDDSPIGKQQNDHVANLKKGRDRDASAPAEFQGKDKDWYTSEIAKISKRISYGRRSIIRAMLLQHQMWDIEQFLPQVGVKFMTEDNDGVEQFSSSTKPVKVFENIVGGSSDVISVGSFLNLDVMVAKEKGGTFAELMKTANRERKQAETKGLVIEKFEQFDDAAATMASFMLKLAADKRALTKFIAELSKKENDDLLLSMYMLEGELNKFTSTGSFEQRIQDLLSNQKV